MFPAKDAAVESYQRLREQFGGNAVAMLVYHSPQLLTSEGIEQVRQLSEQAGQIPGVQGVLSLAQVDEALQQTQPQRLFGLPTQDAILEQTPLASGFRELFAGYTHANDGRYAAVVTMLDPQTPDLHPPAIAQLRKLAATLDPINHPVALVGEPVLVAEGFQLVEADGQRLANITIILLGFVTLVLFRSFRWVIAQLTIIFWSVIMTRALCVWLGLQLSMVSSMLTAIITVIAVASVIHIAMRFDARRRRDDRPREAATRTLQTLLPPITWACLTDAAGFAALMVSQVGPVRDFGLMMTGGALMVLLAILFMIPFLLLLPPHRQHGAPLPGDRWIRRQLVRVLLVLQQHRFAISIITLAIVVFTALGLSRLQTETNFIRNFRASSELAQSYAMVENDFGGAGVWDVVLPAPRQLTPAYLTSVRALEVKLRAIQLPPFPPQSANKNESKTPPGQLSKVLSIADADQVAATSPVLAIAPPAVRITGMRTAMPTFVDALITDTQPARFLRIMLRSPERISAKQKLQLINAVEQTVSDHTSTSSWQQLLDADTPPQGAVTGYYVLLARLIESLLSDQWLCLLVAGIAVYAMISIALKSWSLALLCLIPNVLPVLAVLGCLGLFQYRVNIGAAMIAAVSLGLTIDGSIHFLTSYLGACRRGDDRLRAVMHAQRQTGLPVLLATVALAAGFSVLATSTFIPTVTFGVLITAALAAGTLANLTLLPLLLLATYRKPA